MGTMDALITADRNIIFSDWDDDGVQVREGDRGTARDIEAVIFRNPQENIPGTPSGYSRFVDVMIKNHATEGLDAVIVGRHQLKFAARVGGQATWHPITEIIGQDAAIWQLRIRTNG